MGFKDLINKHKKWANKHFSFSPKQEKREIKKKPLKSLKNQQLGNKKQDIKSKEYDDEIKSLIEEDNLQVRGTLKVKFSNGKLLEIREIKYYLTKDGKLKTFGGFNDYGTNFMCLNYLKEELNRILENPTQTNEKIRYEIIDLTTSLTKKVTEIKGKEKELFLAKKKKDL